MKTAVEWLIEEMHKNIDWIPVPMQEQALEIEKEQIIEAHFNGCEIGEMFNNENRAFITDSEQYYNQTFKQQEQ
jgi:hypothetical protein